MYDYNNKSTGKQRLTSKKQMQHGVLFCSSLLQPEVRRLEGSACRGVPEAQLGLGGGGRGVEPSRRRAGGDTT